MTEAVKKKKKKLTELRRNVIFTSSTLLEVAPRAVGTATIRFHQITYLRLAKADPKSGHETVFALKYF